MSALSLARLVAGGPSGVFVLAGNVPRRRLASLCRLKNRDGYYVDCRDVRTKPRLMHALARGLALPAYFGSNWDALADCLTDFDRAAADGYVVVLDGLESFAQRSPQEYATLLAVLDDAAAYWREEEVSFQAILAGDPETLGPELPVITPG